MNKETFVPHDIRDTNLPTLEPYTYAVVLSKEGYKPKVLYTGTIEACRSYLNLFSYGKRRFADYFIRNRDSTLLKDGYVLTVEDAYPYLV